ncbi:MAG: aminoacyl-tRNA hydrolase [Firmicutes bacterium]|nr:aminoacyl-tRNA hydrolase [Bacillota bacterium]
MYIIAGLGNPGREYKWTRHNVGYEVVDKFAYDHDIDVSKNKFRALMGEGRFANEKVILVKPLTYMNLSGESLRDIVSFYKADVDKLIVCCDDVNLPLGNIRIRKSGSDGGQNGLKNIIYQLGDDGFPRVRVGVGMKPEKFDLKDYVLSKFSNDEDDDIISGITDAVTAVEMIIKGGRGMEDAMNKFNKKVKEQK